MKNADWREYRNFTSPGPIFNGAKMSGVYYEGRRVSGECQVWRVSRGIRSPVKERLDVWNHSPCGFEWGYGGSGPAQLALAILLAEGLPPDEACELHQVFKWEVIATIKSNHWAMSSSAVRQWISCRSQASQDEWHGAGLADGPVDLSAAPEDEARMEDGGDVPR